MGGYKRSTSNLLKKYPKSNFFILIFSHIYAKACNKGDPNDYKWDSRDPQRTPFQWDDSPNAGFCESCKPWLPVNTNYQELNLEKQRQAEKSFFKFYQQLSTLRTTDDFKYGHFVSKAYDNDVFAFKRSYDGHSHIVLINFGNLNHTINVNEMNTGESTFAPKMKVVVAGSRSSKFLLNIFIKNKLIFFYSRL